MVSKRKLLNAAVPVVVLTVVFSTLLRSPSICSLTTSTTEEEECAQFSLQFFEGTESTIKTEEDGVDYWQSEYEEEMKKMNVPPLEPIQVFEEWKSHHSAQALRKAPSLKGRKFILAKFACPMQTGIQGTDYVGAVLMAVATNRTLMYQYNGIRGWILSGQNSQEKCERILRRADWIPLWEEFKDQLPKKPTRVNRTYYDEKNMTEMYYRIDNGLPVHEDISNVTFLEAPRLWDIGLNGGYFRGLLNLRTKYASTYVSEMFGFDPPFHKQERMEKLHKEGLLFLFGMFFWQSFSLTDELLESVRDDMVVANSSVFSFGMHSRHSSNKEDGVDVSSENKCIDKLVDELRDGRPCLAYLMSDRETTKAAVGKYVQTRHNCTVVTVSGYSAQASKKGLAEHGRFAGAGFYQDLAVVGHAESGFVSKRRSSSEFVALYMEYRRRKSLWESQGIRESKQMKVCSY